MGLARAWSVALRGVEGHVVEIEADIGGGLPGCTWSACRTPPCRSRGTGCGRRWSTPAARGRTSGWCWRSRRRRCGRPGAGSISHWRAGCSRRPGRSSSAHWKARAGGGTGARRAATGGARRAAVPARGAHRGHPPRGGARGRAARGGACRRDPGVRRGDAGTGAGLVEGVAVLARPSPPRPGRPQRSTTSRTSWGRTTPAGRWRSLRRVGTTCCWSGHPARGRRCSRSGSSGCCPSSPRTRRWRSPPSARSRACCPPRASRARRRSWRRTTRRRWRHWSAAGAGSPSRARCRSRTAGRSSWTRRPSSRATSSTRCARRWRRTRSGSPGRTARCAIPPGSSSCSRRTRARARPRTTATACARRSSGAATSGACPGPCSTASTYARRMYPVTALSVVGAPAEETATVRARFGRPCGGSGPLDGVRLAVQRGRARSRAAGPLRAAGPGGPAAGRRVAERRADGARRGPCVASRLDGRRPAGARPAGSRERRAGPLLPRPRAA